MLEKLNKWKWILTAFFCILLRYTLPSNFIEKYYSLGLFRWIRYLFDHTFGKLPFPSYYLFVLFLIIIILKWILHFFKEKPDPFKVRIFNIASFIAFLTTLFLILWGFNYGRVSIESKLKLDIKPLTDSIILAEIDSTSLKLVAIRHAIKDDTNSMPQIIFINNIEENSRIALNNVLTKLQYPSSKVRGRFVFEDFFLVAGIGGQYLPFVGEGNVDDAVFYSKKPFYLMHEMTHGNGFGEESDCNFMAYVACTQSDKLPFQYSGELNYLIYLLGTLKETNKDAYTYILTKIPRIILKDLEEIKTYNLKHNFKTAHIGDAINNIFLKTMGIKDGVKNYDKMLLLVYAWKHKNYN